MLIIEGQLCEARPVLRRRCASDLKDFDQLITVVLTGKQGLSVHNLGEDAANRPDVDRSCVVFGAKQDIGCTVPQSDDLVSEVLDRDAEGASETEICQLQQTFSVDEQVLRLEVSMEHFVPMTLLYSVQELIQVFLQGVEQRGLRGELLGFQLTLT